MTEQTKKILHVDDEPDITFIIEFVLTSGGFDVVRLNDSSKAVSELESGNYSLLILDLMMPQMDGFTVLENLRQQDKLKNLSVLILSSRQLSTEETELLRSRNAQMMSKPFEPHRLLEKVREMITE